MLRLLVFLAVVGAAAIGISWLGDNPGVVTLNWRGVEYETSLVVALGVVLGVAIALGIVWSILRFVLRLPSLVALAARVRRREKGFNALSRGLVAIGAGDARAARRHAAEAHKLIGHEPLAKLLRAQSAQLNGDRGAAQSAFREMLEHPDTHALGLRGLHVEARRAGEHDSALDYAARAHQHAPLPWAAQALLEDNARRSDWSGALATVESNAAAKLLDKPTANRWRAVLKTAIAQDLAERDAKGALSLAQEALGLAPTLVPAAALAGKLLAGAGDFRKASKVLEAAYRTTPHPDLAAAYLRVRIGDSTLDRFARARTLARLAPNDPESQMTLARAALDAHEFDAAQEALAPLVSYAPGAARPTPRVCLLQSELEEALGHDGAAREWLSRAARAPRDRAWVAEGFVSDHWSPVSPAGTLDAFVWRAPDELLTAIDAPPPPLPDEPVAPPAAAAIAAPEAAPPAPVAAEAPTPVRTVAPLVGRANPSPVVLMPSAAPDDPGPHKPAQESAPDPRYAGGPDGI